MSPRSPRQPRRAPAATTADRPIEGPASVPAADGPAALALWIQPRASADAVVGERQGMVAIRLQAPPVDGAANKALIRFLARQLGCSANAVQVLRGEKGRCKLVVVAGLSAAVLRSRLLALSGR